MATPKKKPSEMTTDEAIRKLFGKKRAELLKKTAQDLDEQKPNKSRGKKQPE